MSVDTDQILSLSGGRFQDFVATLAPDQAEAVQSHMETRMADAGQYLIHQGEESEYTLFIEEGAVEVIVGEPDAKPVSYLGRGDVIGEMGMLNQQSRNAHIRASSPVVYKVIYADKFKQLMAEVPGFAIFFAGRMARMVKGSKPSRQHGSNCTDLAGKLPNFDLIAVLYTIASSGASGQLSVTYDDENLIGNLYIQEGIVIYAQFRNLNSLEACYQLLSEHVVGAFAFTRDVTLEEGASPAGAVTVSIDNLVQRASAIREELTTFPTGIMNLQGTIKVLSPDDPGAPADQRERNEWILGFCRKGVLDLPTLYAKSGYCLYHFAKTIHYMTTIGMVGLK